MLESGLIYKLISTAVQSMALLSEGFCLEKLLTGRKERGGRKVRIISWTAWGSIFVIIKCMCSVPPLYYGVLHPTILLVTHIFLLLYFYSDKLWVRFAHTGILIMQNVLAEFILYYMFGQVKHLDFLNPDFSNPYMVERCCMIAMLSIFMNIIYTSVMLKWKKKRQNVVSPFGLVAMLQLMCVFLAMCELKWSGTGNFEHNLYAVYMGGSVVLEFGMLLFFFNQAEKHAIKEQVKNLQMEAELKKAYYEQTEVRRHEIGKLQRDYREILTSLLELLGNGKTTEAEAVISDLSVRIRATKEYPFCKVPVVNAVLTEKQQACVEKEIAFTAHLLLPDTMGIAELDLCMIFGNLLDNAIRACTEAKAKRKTSEITLKSGIAKEYLIIKCRNTALENQKHKIWGSGYGHKILADIAKKYDGDFQTVYENGFYMAQMSLRLRN